MYLQETQADDLFCPISRPIHTLYNSYIKRRHAAHNFAERLAPVCRHITLFISSLIASGMTIPRGDCHNWSQVCRHVALPIIVHVHYRFLQSRLADDLLALHRCDPTLLRLPTLVLSLLTYRTWKAQNVVRESRPIGLADHMLALHWNDNSLLTLPEQVPRVWAHHTVHYDCLRSKLVDDLLELRRFDSLRRLPQLVPSLQAHHTFPFRCPQSRLADHLLELHRSADTATTGPKSAGTSHCPFSLPPKQTS